MNPLKSKYYQVVVSPLNAKPDRAWNSPKTEKSDLSTAKTIPEPQFICGSCYHVVYLDDVLICDFTGEPPTVRTACQKFAYQKISCGDCMFFFDAESACSANNIFCTNNTAACIQFKS